MKVKHFTVIFFLLLTGMMLSSFSGLAQDKGLSPNELTDPNHGDANLNEEKTTPSDHESKPRITTIDSSMMHGKPAPLPSPHSGRVKSEHKVSPSKEEDDALSFNFLYYIIEKFKFSDLIDE